MKSVKVESLGAVVAGECDKQIDGVCSYPGGQIGALFVYNDSHGNQVNVCKKCADYLVQSGEWSLDEGLSALKQLNSAHKTRFPHFVKGKHVKLRISDGTVLEGTIENVYDHGITVNNEAPAAGGFNEAVTISWIEIISEI